MIIFITNVNINKNTHNTFKLTKRISVDIFFKFNCTNLEYNVVNLLQATNTSVKMESDTKSQNPSVTKITILK